MPTIICTVTTDLSYDQRMARICSALQQEGYTVILVGRKKRSSIPLTNTPYKQVRLNPIFQKGALFYATYNIMLFFYLLFKKADVLCAIDLDTILPVLYISKLKGSKRVYDAHELFTQMPEILNRPRVLSIWQRIERMAVPQFKYGYTVSEHLARYFKKTYNRNFEVIRNMPEPLYPQPHARDAYIICQGAINQSFSFETLIPAIKHTGSKLILCGDGVYRPQVEKLISQHKAENFIHITGMLPPNELKKYTANARFGLYIATHEGGNNYYSLSNRFLDYIQSGTPQISMSFPEYKKINDEHQVALLIDDTKEATIIAAIEKLQHDEQLLRKLEENACKAANTLNWQHEKKSIIHFYKTLLG